MNNNTSINKTTHLEFGPLSTVIWEPEYYSELLCDARRSGTIDTIEMLLEEWVESRNLHHTEEPFRAPPGNFNKAIKVAIRTGRLDVAAYLLKKGRGFQVTEEVVRSAVKAGSTEALDVLLNHGWNVDMREFQPCISIAIKLDSIPIVKWFLDHGCSANYQPRNMLASSPLSAAASRASLEMVQLLCSHGADPSQGDVVLHVVLSRRRNEFRKPVLRYLLEQGAPVNELKDAKCPAKWNYTTSSNKRAQAPLHRVVRKREWALAKILLEFGAVWDMEDSRGESNRELAKRKGQKHMIKKLMKEIEDERAPAVKPYYVVKSLL